MFSWLVSAAVPLPTDSSHLSHPSGPDRHQFGMIASGQNDAASMAIVTTPEKAAEVILNGVRRNQRRILIGGDAVATDLSATHGVRITHADGATETVVADVAAAPRCVAAAYAAAHDVLVVAAAGWVWQQTWLLVVALGILGEELFETSRILTALNRAPRRGVGAGG